MTNISGITYAHIKNAPTHASILAQIKKILYNKAVVGHTLWKDLEVCGLKDWKGAKATIDISEFKPYQYPNGKLISLKQLSSKFLGKSIQDERHSSLEDAVATMQLFTRSKQAILKQMNFLA